MLSSVMDQFTFKPVPGAGLVVLAGFEPLVAVFSTDRNVSQVSGTVLDLVVLQLGLALIKTTLGLEYEVLLHE